METRWLCNTPETIVKLREESKGVCIIPMGCVEKHGLHLPVGTDIITASKIAYEASKIETACIFPDFVFGDVPGKVPYSVPVGTISIPMSTQMILLEQLCSCISDNGFKKILVYNGHGGNFWLTAFARELKHKDIDFVFASKEAEYSVPHVMAKIIEEKGSGSVPELTEEDEQLILKYHRENLKTGHACFCEAAYVMATEPASVHLERLGVESGKSTERSKHLKEVGIDVESYGWNIDFPNAFDGDDPIGCNERIGRAAVRLEAEQLARAIKVFKEDTVASDWVANHRWK